jgi:hypothetical protein
MTEANAVMVIPLVLQNKDKKQWQKLMVIPLVLQKMTKTMTEANGNTSSLTKQR